MEVMTLMTGVSSTLVQQMATEIMMATANASPFLVANTFIVEEMGDSSVQVGGVWGFSRRRGWTLLYLLNLRDSAANHRDGMWFNASGTNMTSGKRDAYDTLPVDFIGFSVHATNNETDLLDGRSFRVWANEATCAPSGRYSNISDAAAVFLSRDRMHCSLGLTWKQLLVLTQNEETRDRISTGGLGKRLVNEVKVWVCDRDNECSEPINPMCFVYEEVHRMFIPWGLEAQVFHR